MTAAIDFIELYSAAAAQVGQEYESEFAGGMELLATNLLKAYGYSDRLIELHVHMPDFVTQVSKRPVASKIARWQALSEYKVTNLRHERVKLDPFIRPLLPYVDGTHDHGDLLSIARDLLHKGEIESFGNDGLDPHSAEEIEMLSDELGSNLRSLGRSALLEA